MLDVPIHCLVVQRSRGRFKLLLQWLRRSGLPVQLSRVASPQQFRQALSGPRFDAILAVSDGSELSPVQALEICLESNLDVPFLVLVEPGSKRLDLGTVTQVTSFRALQAELRATNEQLRSLRAIREEEEARLAREIHDEFGSALTSLRWDLEAVDKAFQETGNLPLRDKVAAMVRLIDVTVTSVRRISSELRPGILDDLGLVAAIEWQAQSFQAHTGIFCQCDSAVDQLDLTPEQATAVFRILQEAMTNILRHAQANRVNITIEVDEGIFILEIRDNGKGISREASRNWNSLGLLGMRERAELAGGHVEIEGMPGRGTVLTVRVPVGEGNA